MAGKTPAFFLVDNLGVETRISHSVLTAGGVNGAKKPGVPHSPLEGEGVIAIEEHRLSPL
jgi:hypothetical protein